MKSQVDRAHGENNGCGDVQQPTAGAWSLPRAYRIIAGTLITAVCSIAAFGSFITGIISEETIVRFISGGVNFIVLVCFGTGIMILSGSWSVQRLLAWAAIVGGLFLYGVCLILYAQHGLTPTWLWLLALPFPSFSAMTWGSTYLISGPRLIMKLRTRPLYVWSFAGFIGGSLSAWFMIPWEKITVFRHYPSLKLIVLLGLCLFPVVIALMWFLAKNKKG